MKALVVYTSIVGNFDTLLQPIVADDSVDYICFVEKGSLNESHIGYWKIREIPYNNDDDRILSRYPKLNPHLLLYDYEYSLWIDGNVSIASNELYKIIRCKIKSNIIYSGVNHWGRDCAFEDAFACINLEKESVENVLSILKILKKEKLPRHFGMYENNVILRKHNDPVIVDFDNQWWSYYLKYSHRDQLSHSLCYMKSGLKFDYLIPREFCSRNHKYFKYVKHANKNYKRNLLVLIRCKIKLLIVRILYSFM